MHVISQRQLREFWQKHPQAEGPLRVWYKVARAAEWKKFEDVKSAYATADRVAQFTIFNIGGNKWRLIAAIHYDRGKLYIRHVFTHAEYDDWNDALRQPERRSKRK